MPKPKQPVHITQFPTKNLANLFARVLSETVSHRTIASCLGVSVQKISAIGRHGSARTAAQAAARAKTHAKK